MESRNRKDVGKIPHCPEALFAYAVFAKLAFQLLSANYSSTIRHEFIKLKNQY